nr:hypothetical protein [Verrucomicrobium spinosum]
MDLPIRPRRNRRTEAIRGLVRETELTAAHLIYPLFLHAGTADQPIESMPGCTRWSLAGLVKEAGEAHALGVPAVVLFPAISDKLKTKDAREAWNAKGLVPKAIALSRRPIPHSPSSRTWRWTRTTRMGTTGWSPTTDASSMMRPLQPW